MLGSAKTTSVSRQLDRLQAQVMDLNDQLSRYAGREKKHVGRLAGRVADTVSARYDDYGRQLADFGETANDQIQWAGKQLKGEMKHHPFRALVVAALIGVALGALSRSR